MIGGLNGLKGLDPKRREPRTPKVEPLGCVGVCLETLSTPPGGHLRLQEIEFWTGAGYTGTKLTGTPYATIETGGGSVTGAFDGTTSPSTWWQADLTILSAKVGLITQVNPVEYAGKPGLPFVGGASPKSFRLNAYNGANFWCSDYRVYVLNAAWVDGEVRQAWTVAGKFSGIAYPGASTWWGTDL